MSPAMIRLTAIGCTLFGLTAQVLMGPWALSWSTAPIVRVMVIMMLSVLLFSQLTRRAERDLPATFVVTRRGFAVRPTVTSRSGSALIWLMLIGHMAIEQWFDMGTPDLVYTAALTVVPAVAFFLRRPQVVLTKDGLVLQEFLEKKVHVDWDEMLAWQAKPYREGGGLQVLRRAERPLSLPVTKLATDPAFLAFAIDRYIKEPQARAGIGDAAELAELTEGWRLKTASADRESAAGAHPAGTPTA